MITSVTVTEKRGACKESFLETPLYLGIRGSDLRRRTGARCATLSLPLARLGKAVKVGRSGRDEMVDSCSSCFLNAPDILKQYIRQHARALWDGGLEYREPPSDRINTESSHFAPENDTTSSGFRAIHSRTACWTLMEVCCL